MAGEVIRDDPLLTIDDVIRGGACIDGAYAALRRISERVSAAMPASEILKLLPEDEQPHVTRAAKLDGYGYGDGYGDGNGNGDGYGYGNGYGDGDGYGNGYGDGDGDG